MTARLRNPEFLGWLLMLGAIGVAAGFIFWLQRNLIFGSDEFLWLQLAGLGELDSFFRPYGGHLIAFPFFLWRGILEVFGTDFTAFTAVQVFGLSLSAAFLYIYGKRRIGPILALFPPVILLFIGTSWSPLLQPMIGIQFLAALVPGLGAMLMLEREDRLGDVAACGLLGLSLLGFTEGVAFVVGAAIAIALGPEWRRRVWVVAIPLVAYGIWHLWSRKYGSAPIGLSNIPYYPSYVIDSLGVIISSIFGLGAIVGPGDWANLRLNGYDFVPLSAGVVFTILELLLIWRALSLMLRRGPIPRTFWPALGILLTLWAAQSLAFAPDRTPAEIRYIYTGTLLLLLVVVEMLRGVKTTPTAVIVGLALTVAAVVGNLPHFREGRQLLDAYQATARADMAVIELAGRDADHAFTPNISAPDIANSGLAFNTGPWLNVVARYGSVADSIPELRREPEPLREHADLMAVRALGLEFAEVPRTAARGCASFGRHAGPTQVVLPRGGAVLRPFSDTEVALRRWASEFTAPMGSVAAGRPVALRIPPDTATRPWRLRFERGPVDVCPL